MGTEIKRPGFESRWHRSVSERQKLDNEIEPSPPKKRRLENQSCALATEQHCDLVVTALSYYTSDKVISHFDLNYLKSLLRQLLYRIHLAQIYLKLMNKTGFSGVQCL